jgi:hypothetical protein
MKKAFVILFGFLVCLIFIMMNASQAQAIPPAQLPTGSIPTVTGTATGPLVRVSSVGNEEFINIRSGPNTIYPKVGLLLVGQEAPALGKTAGGEWIQIAYPGVQGGKGWVYAFNVEVDPGFLPIVEPPPSPTPEFTATIDPTLAAQFVVTIEATRLPTFTEPAPIQIPTFVEKSYNQVPGGIPMGLIIMVLGIIGILLSVFSFLQRR